VTVLENDTKEELSTKHGTDNRRAQENLN